MSQRLKIINSMLATTGTAPLTAADSGHPNYTKANAALEDVLEEFFSKEMWFNTSVRTLQPNSDGQIVVPSDAYVCEPVDGAKDYSIRGQYLWDNGNYTDNIGTSVECIIVTTLPLEDLPPVAYQYIRADARYRYFTDQDGAGSKIPVLKEVRDSKWMEFDAKNINMMDANFFNSAAYQNFATRRGSLPFIKVR